MHLPDSPYPDTFGLFRGALISDGFPCVFLGLRDCRVSLATGIIAMRLGTCWISANFANKTHLFSLFSV